MAYLEWEEFGRSNRRSERSIRGLEDLVAQKEQSTRVYERAIASLQSVESDAQRNRDARRRAVKSDFQKLERALTTVSPTRKDRVFDSEAERDAYKKAG